VAIKESVKLVDQEAKASFVQLGHTENSILYVPRGERQVTTGQ